MHTSWIHLAEQAQTTAERLQLQAQPRRWSGFPRQGHFQLLSLHPCSSYTSFESFAITIQFGHRILTVFNIYGPDSDNGHTEPFTTFIDQFQSFLAVAATTPHDFIITGDFNIHVNKSDSRNSQFLDILN